MMLLHNLTSPTLSSPCFLFFISVGGGEKKGLQKYMADALQEIRNTGHKLKTVLRV